MEVQVNNLVIDTVGGLERIKETDSLETRQIKRRWNDLLIALAMEKRFQIDYPILADLYEQYRTTYTLIKSNENRLNK